MEELDEIKELVFHYLRGIWKNRWIAILIAWPILIGGVVAVDQMKNRYTAQTKVYIDSSSVLKPLLRGLAIQTDFQAIVRLMIGKLLSRPNLERAARLMDMDINVRTPAEMEALLGKIRSRVEISASARTNTYTITYSDENRQTAERMVQTLLDIFVEDTLGTSVNESDSAIAFLDKQITKYDQLLREAEDRRENFKRKNVGIMPKDGANYYSQLQDVNNRLEQAKLSLEESINRRDKIKFQLENLNDNSKTEDTGTSVTSNLDNRISEQETKLQDLLLLYTEQHPDVINAKLILESLRQRREEKLNQVQENSEDGSVDANNPLYQELIILLTQTEADISSYKTRVAALQTKQASLKQLVDVVPQIESELQRLNRDYEVHKQNYNELVQRREQAKISEDVESGTEQVKFRIIEPPFASLKPSYPNRALFDAAVLVLALGIGYGFSLLLSLLRPVYYKADELSTGLEYPVLGSVNKFDTPEVLAKRRRNLLMFALANITFVASGGLLILLHSKGVLILSELHLMVMAL